MSAENQIEVNRRNAQFCITPKTTESREALDELVADFHTRFAPGTPEERSLGDALILYEWLSRLYMAADTAVWNFWLRDDKNKDPGVAFLRYSHELARTGRYFSATLKELNAIQSERKSLEKLEPAAVAVPEPTEIKTVTSKLVSFRQPCENLREILNHPPGSPRNRKKHPARGINTHR